MICLTRPTTLSQQPPLPRIGYKPRNPLLVSPISGSLQDPRRRGARSGGGGGSNGKSPRIHYPKHTHIVKPLSEPPQMKPTVSQPSTDRGWAGEEGARSQVGDRMWVLCGFGYWVQGFRCFPWMAVNFHLAHGLRLSPSTLQLVQNAGNLPLVAKPLFGLLSDAVYIGGAHRLPYISLGVFLQVLSWCMLAIILVTGDMFPAEVACMLLSNLGASVTEVVSDALVTEFSRTQKVGVLQSYSFIAIATGGILGNLSGGYVLLKTQEPKIMFLIFSLFLGAQLILSLSTKEALLCSQLNSDRHVLGSISESFREQLTNLSMAIYEERILYPLSWLMASVAIVPLLSGSMFCFLTQHLKLDPSVIGLSKVIGQLMVLSLAVLYDRHLKRIPMRKLVTGVQILYALALVSDLLLVKQINLKWGISNEVYVLCLSALAEAMAQFKILPFSVLFSSLCPSGCEGSLFAFFASGLCLSSILSGVFGVGLSCLIRVSSGDYSSLPFGILLQFLAALVSLGWISFVPLVSTVDEKIAKSM